MNQPTTYTARPIALRGWILATVIGNIFYPLLYLLLFPPDPWNPMRDAMNPNSYGVILGRTLPYAVLGGLLTGWWQGRLLYGKQSAFAWAWLLATTLGEAAAWVGALYILMPTLEIFSFAFANQQGVFLWLGTGSVVGGCQAIVLRASWGQRVAWIGLSAGAWGAGWLPFWAITIAAEIHAQQPSGPSDLTAWGAMLIFSLTVVLGPIALLMPMLPGVIIGLITGWSVQRMSPPKKATDTSGVAGERVAI